MDSQPRSGPSAGSCRPRERNLVLCIDGTSNQFGFKNTNVIELYSQLVVDDTQLTYYNSGVGTYANPSWRSFSYWKQIVYNSIDLAFAWNFEKIVINAYRWLSDNYEEGDRIFLFGFSRGAYQVRTLAGMIDKVGLINKGNEEQIPFAYELYADPLSDNSTTRRQEPNQVPLSQAARFKQTFSRKNVPVHFTGVWDTVSSVGVIRGKNLPRTISTNNTSFFRHALALDERRVKFLPEYACGGVMKVNQGGRREGLSQAARGSAGRGLQHIKEVWFPGTHSDLGNVSNDSSGRRHPAFLWMAYEAISAGLRLNPTNVEWKWDESGQVHESLVSVWRVLEYLPFKRLSYNDARSYTWRWHRGQGRQIQPGQKVHASVAFCKNYCPKAHLPGGKKLEDWDTLVGSGSRFDTNWTRLWGDLLEMDIFDASAADMVVQKIENPLENPVVWVHRLTAMTWSFEGRTTLRKVDRGAHRLLTAVPNRDMTVQIAVANSVMEFTDDDSLESILAVVRNGDLKINEEFLEKFIHDTQPSPLKLKAFGRLAEDADLRRKIVGSGIATLSASHEEPERYQVRHTTLKCIVGLAKHEGSRCDMLQSDLVAALLVRLEDQDENISGFTISAITQLAKYGDLRCRMVNSNVIPVLLGRHQGMGVNVRLLNVNCITELAQYDDSRYKMIESDVVSALLTRSKNQNSCVCQTTAMAVAELAKYEDLRCKMINSEDVVAALTAGLGDQSSLVRRLTVVAVWQLAKYEDSRSKIVESHIGTALLARLRDQDWHIRQSAANAATELIKHEDSCRELIDSDIVGIVLLAFGDSDWNTYELNLHIFLRVARYGNLRRTMIDSGVFVALLARLEDKDWMFFQLIAKAVVELAKYEDSRCKIVDSNIIEVLLTRLEDQDWMVCQSTANVVAELATHEDSRRKMVDLDVVGALLVRIERQDLPIGQSTVRAIVELAKHEDSRCKMDPNIWAALSARNIGVQCWGSCLSVVDLITQHTESENP